MILSEFEEWIKEPGYIREVMLSYGGGRYYCRLQEADSQLEYYDETLIHAYGAGNSIAEAYEVAKKELE